MNQPLLSVIIPVYNTGEAFLNLYKSINNDQYKNLEIIVVDDGSTDDSLKILRAVAAKDKRLRILSQKNQGASSARNLALKNATGKYVFFIDSDDDILPAHFTELTAKFEKEDAGLVSCGYRYHRVYNDKSHDTYVNAPVKRKPSDTDLSFILRQDVKDGRLYASTNKAFRLSVIRAGNITFDTHKKFAEDTKFVLDYLSVLIKTHTLKISYVLKATYLYHYGTETSTVRESSLIWGNWLASFQDFKAFAKQNGPYQFREKRLLFLLKCRFHISHAFAVARSNQKFSQKLHYANIFKLLPAEIIVKFRK
ncbi:glycosyltransferase family 2 protein [Candidatus Saccharibacteria bacterium]|nr:glycosyltransferase family 2 protein [Candidatus Saccharibacteria bacterium]MBQ3467945.1 glycosyltransferase family 2 protein [Candidatus Saccharibacteria bacterium]